MDVEIRGVEKVINNLNSMDKKTKAKLKLAMNRIGEEIIQEVKAEITRVGAVDTGNMRRSTDKITTENGNEITTIVGIDPDRADYAKYVHWGTSKMQGRPFMVTVSKKMQSKIKKELESAIESVI